MIIKISSQNPLFLDILHKNPDTDEGLYLKSYKNGVLLGNVIDAHEYHCLFQDTKYSYLPEEANQIDFQSHCSPLAALNIASEFFNHLYKENEVLKESVMSWLNKSYLEVDTMPARLEVATFFMDSTWYRNDRYLLSKYIKGIELVPKIGNNFTLIVEGDSVIETMQKFSIVALFAHVTNNYGIFTFIQDDFAQKYITILTNLKGIPYFVFYLFIRRIIKSPKQFALFKPQMEAYFDNEIQFVYADTHQSRKDFICENIDKNVQVLDFGCGELQYFKRLTKMGFKEKYWAHDEADYEPLVNKIREMDKVENLFWLGEKDDIKGFEGQIILSEVIEHNSLEEAENILTWIRNNTKFTQIFITTPNSEFNVNYEMSTEFRHEDHDIELTKAEFISLIEKVFGKNYEYFGLGDCVKGIYPTSAVIIKN